MKHYNKVFPSFLQATIFTIIIIPVLQIIVTVLIKISNIQTDDSINKTIAYSISMILAFFLLYRTSIWKNKSCHFSFKLINWKLIPITLMLALLLSIFETITLISFVTVLPSLAQKSGNNVDFTYLINGIFIAPILEEFIFRGVFLDNFLKRYSCKIAIFMSAFLFAVIHLNLLYIPLTTISYCIVGWMYSHTRSLLHCIIYHATSNAITLGFVYYWTKYIKPVSTPSSEEFSNKEITILVLAFIASAILLTVCLRSINKIFRQTKALQIQE